MLARVGRWIDTLAGTDQPVIAVTHKGVLRALMVAATGSDMLGKAPVKLGVRARTHSPSTAQESFTPSGRTSRS